jgi:hypothetical protein
MGALQFIHVPHYRYLSGLHNCSTDHDAQPMDLGVARDGVR